MEGAVERALFCCSIFINDPCRLYHAAHIGTDYLSELVFVVGQVDHGYLLYRLVFGELHTLLEVVEGQFGNEFMLEHVLTPVVLVGKPHHW